MVSSMLTLPAPVSLQAMGIQSHSNDKNVKPVLPSLSGRTCQILVTANLPLFTLLWNTSYSDQFCGWKSLNE